MQLYFRAAVFYAAFSFLIVSLRFGDPIELISTSVVATLAVTGYNALHVVLPVLLALFVVLGRLAFLKRGSEALYAVFGALILQLAFSFVKSTIPALVPFYADPYLASVDRVLAGGQDAWRVANDIGPYVGARMLLPAYLNVWTVFVMAMPLAVALTDDDTARVRRFVILRLTVWVLLGNIFALMFSSVGPVYYDRLLGGTRFAGLAEALDGNGVMGSLIGHIQGYLWNAYMHQQMEFASGISAFPSVHVGIATVAAIYLGERSRWLIAPGVLFVAVILYLSVYTGYHYAIDGYFSIAVILMVWGWLRLRDARRGDVAGGAIDGLPRAGG